MMYLDVTEVARMSFTFPLDRWERTKNSNLTFQNKGRLRKQKE